MKWQAMQAIVSKFVDYESNINSKMKVDISSFYGSSPSPCEPFFLVPHKSSSSMLSGNSLSRICS
jgi:hypothetical protein